VVVAIEVVGVVLVGPNARRRQFIDRGASEAIKASVKCVGTGRLLPDSREHGIGIRPNCSFGSSAAVSNATNATVLLVTMSAGEGHRHPSYRCLRATNATALLVAMSAGEGHRYPSSSASGSFTVAASTLARRGKTPKDHYHPFETLHGYDSNFRRRVLLPNRIAKPFSFVGKGRMTLLEGVEAGHSVGASHTIPRTHARRKEDHR
jgi:hypothetical protein